MKLKKLIVRQMILLTAEVTREIYDETDTQFEEAVRAAINDPRDELIFTHEGDTLEDHIKSISNPITVFTVDEHGYEIPIEKEDLE